VQAGVSNGLSSAFMMLALAKNGPEGRLYAIDIPYIFNPADPWWTVAGQVYGVLIPEGKSSGWMVPDIYRDRVGIEAGDAKLLLPGLIDRLDRIDLFFHDSDHAYHHMMFEFEQVMRKLAPKVSSLRMTSRGMRRCGTLPISTTFRVTTIKEHWGLCSYRGAK
jgi:hypothetical protein